MRFIYFQSTWCQPCKTLSPIMDKVSQRIPVQKIDVDQNPEIASQYGIRSIPAVILVRDNGQEVTRILGAQNELTYINAYNQNK